ncbi:uncharacterized protein DS421_13g446000 [Arachis hypogaea]|nr:uncharacterized protein DS421_13g446000 [Arachis hypogaea]
MGDLASLHQIFVPIHLNSHCFLIVVDLLNEVVKYLDSFKKSRLLTEQITVVFGSLNGCSSLAIGTLVISDYTRMRLAVNLVNNENNSKWDITEKLAVID